MMRRVIFTLGSGAKVTARLKRRGEVSVDHRRGVITAFDATGMTSHTLIVIDPNHVIAIEVVKWWWRA